MSSTLLVHNLSRDIGIGTGRGKSWISTSVIIDYYLHIYSRTTNISVYFVSALPFLYVTSEHKQAHTQSRNPVSDTS